MLRIAFLLLLLTRPLPADEVTDWIDEGRTAWLAGKPDEAIQSLDYASQLIRQQKGERLEAALPAALAGWRKTDSGSSALGSAFFGGATGANAQYERTAGDEGSTCSISIATDNPMMGMLLASFASPMMLTSSGQKLIKIGAHKATLDYDAQERDGTIMVVVGQKVLVSVQGNAVSEADLRAYAEAVHYDVIEKVLQSQ
ncbi:MAG: hypothetical protein Q8O14_09295 [bacterium]|jgi:hypothetical protein|nr:hypothetical protein [bacterium]